MVFVFVYLWVQVFQLELFLWANLYINFYIFFCKKTEIETEKIRNTRGFFPRKKIYGMVLLDKYHWVLPVKLNMFGQCV